MFWIIFSLSFLTALSGAMAPGPLFTYTILKTIQAKRHGFLMGLWIISGHAILESIILFALLLGFSYILTNKIILAVINLSGCFFLIYFGISLIVKIIKGQIPVPSKDEKESVKNQNKTKILKNPVLGGILVSMSNPYWWIWWASIGSTFLVKFNISLNNINNLLAFFLGHEAGDLAWYVPISTLTFFSRKYINKKVYYFILILCSIFLIVFGIYLGISTFLN